MTREDVIAWRAWLHRVERRCGVDDVPILIRRLGVCLTVLEGRAAVEPTQRSLWEVAS